MTIADLQKELSEMLDPLDYPGDWSIRRVEAYDAKRRQLMNLIQLARVATSVLAEAEPQLAAEIEWRDQLLGWRKTLEQEVLDHTPPGTGHEIGMVENRTLSIQAIDRGTHYFNGTGRCLESSRLGELMREAGYKTIPSHDDLMPFGTLPWFGSILEVEGRIKKLTKQRSEARKQLVEALLDEASRQRLEAEQAERRDRLNAMSKADRAAAMAVEKAAALAAEEAARST